MFLFMEKETNQDSPIVRLFRYTKPFRKELLIATLFSISNKLLDLAPPVLIGAAVDIVVRREDSVFAAFGITDLMDQIYVLGVITFIIWFGESLFEYLYKIRWRGLAQEIQHSLRLDCYSHLQDLELEYFEERQTGGLMAVLNNDINQLERFLDTGFNDLIQISTTVVAISGMFFVLSPEVALVGFIPIPLIIIFSIKYQKYLEKRYVRMRETVGIMNAKLSNNLTGISTIKSYTNQKLEINRISEASGKYKSSNIDVIKLSSAFSPLIRMIIVMGFLAMLIMGGQLTLNGEIEVAAYSVLIFLIQRLLWPLTRLGETFDLYQRAMASTARALDLLDTKTKIITGDKPVNGDHTKGEIVVKNVTFNYKSRAAVLQNLDFKIESGQTVGFVGATGAGKSTVLKLLLRFYDPSEGSVIFDGTDIREFKLNDYRKVIGFVPQDAFLIDGTIRENILYGDPDAKMDAVIHAAQIAEIYDFIEELPEGFDTLVGERGQKLSGGQRQRISIARAILKDPPVLIFDEATSSVDNETEAAIQRSLEKITLDRTTILIAHRLSTIKHADTIYVLDSGKIIEKGTHDELLEIDSYYRTLWNVQTGKKGN